MDWFCKTLTCISELIKEWDDSQSSNTERSMPLCHLGRRACLHVSSSLRRQFCVTRAHRSTHPARINHLTRCGHGNLIKKSKSRGDGEKPVRRTSEYPLWLGACHEPLSAAIRRFVSGESWQRWHHSPLPAPPPGALQPPVSLQFHACVQLHVRDKLCFADLRLEKGVLLNDGPQ